MGIKLSRIKFRVRVSLYRGVFSIQHVSFRNSILLCASVWYCQFRIDAHRIWNVSICSAVSIVFHTTQLIRGVLHARVDRRDSVSLYISIQWTLNTLPDTFSVFCLIETVFIFFSLSRREEACFFRKNYWYVTFIANFQLNSLENLALRMREAKRLQRSLTCGWFNSRISNIHSSVQIEFMR